MLLKQNRKATKKLTTSGEKKIRFLYDLKCSTFNQKLLNMQTHESMTPILLKIGQQKLTSNESRY